MKRVSEKRFFKNLFRGFFRLSPRYNNRGIHAAVFGKGSCLTSNVQVYRVGCTKLSYLEINYRRNDNKIYEIQVTVKKDMLGVNPKDIRRFFYAYDVFETTDRTGKLEKIYDSEQQDAEYEIFSTSKSLPNGPIMFLGTNTNRNNDDFVTFIFRCHFTGDFIQQRSGKGLFRMLRFKFSYETKNSKRVRVLADKLGFLYRKIENSYPKGRKFTRRFYPITVPNKNFSPTMFANHDVFKTGFKQDVVCLYDEDLDDELIIPKEKKVRQFSVDDESSTSSSESFSEVDVFSDDLEEEEEDVEEEEEEEEEDVIDDFDDEEVEEKVAEKSIFDIDEEEEIIAPPPPPSRRKRKSAKKNNINKSAEKKKKPGKKTKSTKKPQKTRKKNYDEVLFASPRRTRRLRRNEIKYEEIPAPPPPPRSSKKVVFMNEAPPQLQVEIDWGKPIQDAKMVSQDYQQFFFNQPPPSQQQQQQIEFTEKIDNPFPLLPLYAIPGYDDVEYFVEMRNEPENFMDKMKEFPERLIGRKRCRDRNDRYENQYENIPKFQKV